MIKKLLFFLLIFNGNPNLNALSLSIVIPCNFKHAQHLYNLLSHLEKQTELPNEVVMSISEINKVDPQIIKRLKESSWLFPVKILTSNEVLYAGQNRNKGCMHSQGGLIMTHDADDLSHPQKVEIVKYFFETYRPDHLMFGCDNVEYEKKYELNKISYKFCKNFSEVWTIGFPVTNGNIALSRHVFNKIKWSNAPRGQDVQYNDNVYKNFNKCMVINAHLHDYRSSLSSYRITQSKHAINNSLAFPVVFIDCRDSDNTRQNRIE